MTPLSIPSPSEIAEANRVKDEAADDALLEEWLPKAVAAIHEYRGWQAYALLPGITEDKGCPIHGKTTIRHTRRFEKAVQEAFSGTEWYAELETDQISGWSTLAVHTGRMAFGSAKEREERQRKEEEWAAEKELEYQRDRAAIQTRYRVKPIDSPSPPPKPELEAEDRAPAKPSRRWFSSFLRGNP